MANGRTGQVQVEDFDIGVATTIGSELINVEHDGELIQVYAVRIEGVTGPDEYQGLIPVIMSDSEDAFQAQLLPQIVVSRGAITPQMNRWFPGGREYQIPAPGSPQVPVPGTNRTMSKRVEKKWWTLPFEISYDLHLRARLRWQANKMFKHVGRFFWAYGQVFLKDSENEERGYYAFVESIDSLNEIADIADRLQGHTISMRVEGELDFAEPFILPTQQKLTLGVEMKGA
jgi:hypothetical protein